MSSGSSLSQYKKRHKKPVRSRMESTREHGDFFKMKTATDEIDVGGAQVTKQNVSLMESSPTFALVDAGELPPC